MGFTTLKGHSQLMRMCIRYHFPANLHITTARVWVQKPVGKSLNLLNRSKCKSTLLLHSIIYTRALIFFNTMDNLQMNMSREGETSISDKSKVEGIEESAEVRNTLWFLSDTLLRRTSWYFDSLIFLPSSELQTKQPWSEHRIVAKESLRTNIFLHAWEHPIFPIYRMVVGSPVFLIDLRYFRQCRRFLC